MKIKKFFCLMLTACLFISVLCACSDPKDPENDLPDSPNVPDTPNDSEEGEDKKEDYLLSLPSYNFNGDEFTILCRADKEYEMDIAAQTGSTVDNAVFARNARIEELYNTEIVSAPVTGTWEKRSEFIGVVKNAVNSGSDDYDMVAGYLAYIAELALDDCFWNLHEVNTIDLSSVWWSESFVENMTLFDCLYYVDGDLSLTMWESLFAMYFNKQIAEDRHVEDLYQLVKDGEWTMERLYEITEDLYQDNGNDYVDTEDFFGLITNCHSVRAMVTTCGRPLTARNDEDTYDLVFFNEETIDLFDELYSYINGNDSVYMITSSDSNYPEMLKMFTNNQALFITATLAQSATLRSMDTVFGIIPFPKYDDFQETYLSHSHDGQSIFSIPSSLTDPSMAGAILDALGAESRQSVIPQYYDVVLKGRTVRDDESGAMLDIIRDHLYFDFGFVYSLSLDYIYSTFGNLIKTKDRTFVSVYAASADKYAAKLADIIEKYEGIS